MQNAMYFVIKEIIVIIRSMCSFFIYFSLYNLY